MRNSRLSLRKAASSVRSSVVSPVLPSSRTRRGGSSGCRATGRSTKYSHQRASCLDDGGCRVCDGAVHGPHAPYLGRRHLRSSDLGASRTCHPHHPGSARGNGLSRKPCSSRATRPPRTAGSLFGLTHRPLARFSWDGLHYAWAALKGDRRLRSSRPTKTATPSPTGLLLLRRSGPNLLRP